MLEAYDYLSNFTAVHRTPNKTTFENYDIGCSHNSVARTSVQSCTDGRQPPIVVYAARPEYTTNLYHAMEEVYALYETAFLLHYNLSSTTLVFVEPQRPFRRHIFELFATIVGNVVTVTTTHPT